jgi:hypothetical protein
MGNGSGSLSWEGRGTSEGSEGFPSVVGARDFCARRGGRMRDDLPGAFLRFFGSRRATGSRPWGCEGSAGWPLTNWRETAETLIGATAQIRW